MTILDFQRKFHSEQAVIQHFIKVRYNNQLHCNHCKSHKVHPRINRPRIFQCSDCGKDFSIFKGTIFEKSTTDLYKWFYGIHLFLNAKKGISALHLQRELGVTYKTAWRMFKQIRTAMGNADFTQLFDQIIEMDETYVGGKHKGSTRGRGTPRTPVIGIKDRARKLVYAEVAFPDCAGQKLTGKQLAEVLGKVAKPGTTVMTDELRAYRLLSKLGYNHLRINHSQRFVDGIIHTNGIESFWSTLKRAHYGTYHSISDKYLQNYVDEVCFRYNNRTNPDIYDTLLEQSIQE